MCFENVWSETCDCHPGGVEDLDGEIIDKQLGIAVCVADHIGVCLTVTRKLFAVQT